MTDAAFQPLPHVVLSTKYEPPWLQISKNMKDILEKHGCSVYNPNTDNEAANKHEADAQWLRTFNRHLEVVKQTKGFVLQIQQGAKRERTDMQLAEEKQAGWLQVPRIGIYAFAEEFPLEGTVVETSLIRAIDMAKEQWDHGIAKGVMMCSEIWETVQFTVDAVGSVTGPAKVKFPDGATMEGYFVRGLKHGSCRYQSRDGRVELGLYSMDVPIVEIHRSTSGNFFKFKDGEELEQISPKEAEEIQQGYVLPPW